MGALTERGLLWVALALSPLLLAMLGAPPSEATPPPSETIKTEFGFAELRERLTKAVEANGMFVVTTACASCGAAKRGITIPGNMVIGVYRNDFAVRMLEASMPAGIEAPIRFYLTENADGTASLTYRMPSTVFAPYGSADLDAMATELDQIWQRIVADAEG
jgi:uncharacterized protein (DUF302 family)